VFKKTNFKNYGLGLGLRKDLRKNILELEPGLVNWLEIVPENYIYRGGINQKNFQQVLSSKIPLIPHGVNLSIGTAPDEGHKVTYDKYLLEGLKDLFSEIQPPWFSDHISCTRINSIYLQDLIPVPRTHEAVEIVANNIKFLQDYFQLAFLVENPSYYSNLIKPELNEADFINKILASSDCGLLLDVNNVFVNAVNHGYSALDFIDSLDLERVVQVHIAGHLENYKCWINNKVLGILDTHGHPIIQEVYDLLAYVTSKTEIKAVLLERDSNFGNFEAIVEELKAINQIL